MGFVWVGACCAVGRVTTVRHVNFEYWIRAIGAHLEEGDRPGALAALEDALARAEQVSFRSYGG